MSPSRYSSEIRKAITTEACEWLGAGYHPNACIKPAPGKPGFVDCGRFPLAVWKSVGLTVPVTPPHWPPDWFLHRMAEQEPYLKIIQEVCQEVDVPLPGDLALFHIGRAWSHTAIVISWPDSVIHTDGVGPDHRVNIADPRQQPLARYRVRFFRNNALLSL